MSKSKAEKDMEKIDMEFSVSYMKNTFPEGSIFHGYIISKDGRTGTRRVCIFGAWVGDDGKPRVADVTAHAARFYGARLTRDIEALMPGGGYSAIEALVNAMSKAVWGHSKGYTSDNY